MGKVHKDSCESLFDDFYLILKFLHQGNWLANSKVSKTNCLRLWIASSSKIADTASASNQFGLHLVLRIANTNSLLIKGRKVKETFYSGFRFLWACSTIGLLEPKFIKRDYEPTKYLESEVIHLNKKKIVAPLSRYRIQAFQGIRINEWLYIKIGPIVFYVHQINLTKL